ncbi:hypothetical protein SKAU_G00333400 [Synaphobranchus kaupii]|uniref:Uncharacterized protein n=1 Tax=Synaphobranchus kaupii TaxID=118154 RepID=A0A9Q1ELN3_SYNKA|nr:hypothetical protein SKAU_G00333400 [Synaphobranchus kaupii]
MWTLEGAADLLTCPPGDTASVLLNGRWGGAAFLWASVGTAFYRARERDREAGSFTHVGGIVSSEGFPANEGEASDIHSPAPRLVSCHQGQPLILRVRTTAPTSRHRNSVKFHPLTSPDLDPFHAPESLGNIAGVVADSNGRMVKRALPTIACVVCGVGPRMAASAGGYMTLW